MIYPPECRDHFLLPPARLHQQIAATPQQDTESAEEYHRNPNSHQAGYMDLRNAQIVSNPVQLFERNRQPLPPFPDHCSALDGFVFAIRFFLQSGMLVADDSGFIELKMRNRLLSNATPPPRYKFVTRPSISVNYTRGVLKYAFAAPEDGRLPLQHLKSLSNSREAVIKSLSHPGIHLLDRWNSRRCALSKFRTAH